MLTRMMMYDPSATLRLVTIGPNVLMFTIDTRYMILDTQYTIHFAVESGRCSRTLQGQRSTYADVVIVIIIECVADKY